MHGDDIWDIVYRVGNSKELKYKMTRIRLSDEDNYRIHTSRCGLVTGKGKCTCKGKHPSVCRCSYCRGE